MTINVYEENGAPVIAPEGKIDHVTVEEFESKINELGSKNVKKLWRFSTSQALPITLTSDNFFTCENGNYLL